MPQLNVYMYTAINLLVWTVRHTAVMNLDNNDLHIFYVVAACCICLAIKYVVYSYSPRAVMCCKYL